MKYKMLVLILLLTVMSWAQSATPSASSTPQQSTVPADQAKCACCDKMSARDTKAGATCCAHHNMEAKDGKRWLLKGEVRTVVVQICDLLSGDAVCPACGRADVHTKRTS